MSKNKKQRKYTERKKYTQPKCIEIRKYRILAEGPESARGKIKKKISAKSFQLFCRL